MNDTLTLISDVYKVSLKEDLYKYLVHFDMDKEELYGVKVKSSIGPKDDTSVIITDLKSYYFSVSPDEDYNLEYVVDKYTIPKNLKHKARGNTIIIHNV